MLGAAQFVIGGVAAPLVGAFGGGSAVPMGAVMTGAMLVAGIPCSPASGTARRSPTGAPAGLNGSWRRGRRRSARHRALQAVAGTPSRSS